MTAAGGGWGPGQARRRSIDRGRRGAVGAPTGVPVTAAAAVAGGAGQHVERWKADEEPRWTVQTNSTRGSIDRPGQELVDECRAPGLASPALPCLTHHLHHVIIGASYRA